MARVVPLPGEPDQKGADAVALVVLEPSEFERAVSAVAAERIKGLGVAVPGRIAEGPGAP
jgi:hypothetical protein